MRRWLAVLLAASIATACGAAGDEPVTGAPAPTRSAITTTSAVPSEPQEVVSVAVERSRLFEQQRSLGVTVHNAGDQPAVVDRIRFAAGRYEEVPATDRTVSVPAAGQASFPVPFGAARCDSDDDQIVVHLRIDGVDATRIAPVSGQVQRAHRRECAAAAARRAVRIEFADDWEVVAPRTVQGSLDVTPLAGHQVEVVDVVTSIVFVTQVASSTESGPVLDVVAGRCDTHALTESKKTFTFVVSVAIDGEEPVGVELIPEGGAARASLQRALEDCLDDEGAG